MWMRVDGRSVDLQYNNWAYRNPLRLYNTTLRCVVIRTSQLEWYQFDCNQQIAYVCQS